MNKIEKIIIVAVILAAGGLGVLGYFLFADPSTFFGNQSINRTEPSTSTEEKPAENSSQTDDQAKVATVTYTKQNGFTPEQITIQKGETVKFNNQRDGRPMWVASDPHPAHTKYSQFDTAKALDRFPEPGEDFSFTFTKSGTWTYHDHADPGKTGTVVVE